MLKTLVKIRFQGLFLKSMMGSKKKKISIGKMILFSLLFIYLGIVLVAVFGYFFDLIIEPFIASGYEWLYFGLMALVVILFCFLGSIFYTQQEIYGAKDNDLLLSMPIKTRDILLSRILVVLLLNYVYEALIALPAIIVYYLHQPFNGLQMLIFIIVFVTLPLFVLVLSCVFGWLITMVLKKIPSKTFITMVLSLGVLVAYFYLINKMPEYLASLITNGETIGEIVESKLYPIYHLAKAISDMNLFSLIVYLLTALIPFVLVIYLLSLNFIKLTTSKSGVKKGKLKQTDIKTNGLKKSLFMRELRHFTSNPMVMMNSAIGIAFTIFLAGALIVKSNDVKIIVQSISPLLQGTLNEWLVAGLCLVIIGVSSFNYISASLISLEGNRLWIIKSLPLKTKDILDSKLLLHIVLCIPPAIIFSLAGIYVFSLDIVDALIVILVPVIFIVFEAIFGLLINLWKPKFDWVNETIVVKQSMAVIIAMLGTMAFVVLVAGGYILLFNEFISAINYTYLIAVILIVLDIFGYYLLNTWGAKQFAKF